MCKHNELDVRSDIRFDGYEHGIVHPHTMWWATVCDIDGEFTIEDHFVSDECVWTSTEICHKRTIQYILRGANGKRCIDGMD